MNILYFLVAVVIPEVPNLHQRYKILHVFSNL